MRASLSDIVNPRHVARSVILPLRMSFGPAVLADAIAFGRRLTAASLKQKVPSRVELRVIAEPRGHTTPPGSSERAAEWIHREIERKIP